MGYDAESGLVYTETTISAKPCDCRSNSDGEKRDRAFQAPYELDRSVAATYKQGVRPMQGMVTSQILCNLKSLRATALATHLGESPLLLDKLWSAVKGNALDTLRVWQTFAQVEGVSIERVREHRDWAYKCPRCGPTRLPQLLQLADNPSFAWLTDLSLDERMTTHDLVQIPSLRNVRTLRLLTSIRRNAGFNDAVFKAWADAAKEGQAFTKLETIFVDARDPGSLYEVNITHWSLAQLWKFPALTHYRLRGFQIEDKYTADRYRIGNFVSRHANTNLRSQALGKGDGYLLKLTVGESHRHKTFQAHEVVSFKRDWTPWVPTAKETAPWVDYDLASTVPFERNKRRKIKTGRAQHLGDIMDGLT